MSSQSMLLLFISLRWLQRGAFDASDFFLFEFIGHSYGMGNGIIHRLSPIHLMYEAPWGRRPTTQLRTGWQEINFPNSTAIFVVRQSNTKSHLKLQNVQHISVEWMNGTKLMCLGYLYCTASASHTVRWVHLQSILFVTLDTQHVNIHVRLEELQWTHTVLSRCTFSIPSEKRPSAWLFLAALENMIIIYHWTITMALWTEGGQQAAAPSHRNVRQSFIAIQMPKGNNHTVCGCDFSVKTSEISIGLHHMQTHTTHMDTEKRHTHKHTANGGPRTHSHFARKYFHTLVNGGSTKQQNEQQHQKVILLRW